MANQADLDAAIASLPKALEDALAPVIKAIQDKAPNIDFAPEIAALSSIPAAVAAAVTPVVAPAPAPAQPSV